MRNAAAMLAAGGALLALGCSEGATLRVRVQADYLPGREVVLARAQVRLDESRTDFERVLTSDDPLFDGIDIGEASGLRTGTYQVYVSLLDPSRVGIATRIARVRVVEDATVTLLITRDCRDVACPTSSDDPEATSCQGGQCIFPECFVENDDACPSPACAADADCDLGVDCVIGRCIAGVCLRQGLDERCPSGERCNPDMGCEAAMPLEDAGVERPDAGCGTAEAMCGDGRDDDCDMLIDCADPDCNAMLCAGGEVCVDGTCGGCTPTGGLDGCGGADQDCDGAIDEDCGCERGQWVLGTIDTFGSTGRHGAVAVDDEGGVHVSYLDASEGGLRYAYHPPTGFWRHATLETEGTTGQHTSTALDSRGETHIVFFDATNRDLRYTHRRGDGVWERAVIDSTGDVGRHASLAIDDRDGLHVAYQDVSNGDLRYAYRPNGGAWNVETVLDTGNVGQYARVALDDGGTVHIVARDVSSNALLYVYGRAGAWAGEIVDDAADVGRDASIAVQGDVTRGGRVHIGYRDASRRQARYATRAGIGNGGWTLEAVDQTVSSGEFTSIAVDESGTVHMTYYDGTNADLRYARRDPTGWMVETVESTGAVGGYTSAAVDAGRVVHVAYWDASNRDLRYARRGVDNVWRMEVVDAFGRVGEYASLALGVDGSVHVAYYDASTYDLRYATRPSGGMWSLTTVDASAGVGEGTALALGADGTVHIAYPQPARGDLWYAWRSAGSATFMTARVEDTHNLGIEPAIGVDGRGGVHIAHYDSTDADLRLTSGAPGAWSGVVLDADGSVGRGAAVAIDAQDGIHVAYEDRSNSDVRYITGEVGATFSSPTAVLTSGSVGRYNDLAIDLAGNVHLFAWSETGASLEYAVRPAEGLWSFETVDMPDIVGRVSGGVDATGTVHAVGYQRSTLYDVRGLPIGYDYAVRYARRAPSGGWVASILDDDGNVGEELDLAVSPEGFVHVVYYEADGADLRHARYCP